MGDEAQPILENRSRSRWELCFLGALLSAALAAGVAFLGLTAVAIFVPPMGIALLFGIVVATLAYAFLGAKGDDRFGFRAIQVAGAAAVVLAVVWISNAALERQFKLLERAEELNKRLVIDKRMPPVEIFGGGTIKLLDVNTLVGWHESGTHLENVTRSDAKVIFTSLFDRLDIDEPVENVLAMSEDEWRKFLSTLSEGKRLLIGGIAFATVKVRSSDGQEKALTLFKDLQTPVVSGSDKPEACLTAERILDVRERRSGEPEVLVLHQERGSCS
jgi:hypothetical protein